MEKTQNAKQNKTNNGVFNKIIDKVGVYVLFTLTVFVLFFYLLKEYGVYPFGSYTIANYDYLAQIAPIAENFFYFLEGKTSLFYVKNSLGGVDMFQGVCFMFLSPFTLLILCFGKGRTYHAMSFILPLKIACIGCSALFYMKKRFPKLHPVAAFLIAVLYSVCGYVGTANTYINWMDFLIYMPLLALSFKALIDKRKIKFHAIITTCMIYTCFSISCFSLLLIFPVYFAYIYIVVDKTKRKEKTTDLITSLLYAIIASLPVLIPVFITSSSSSRNVSLFGMLGDNVKNDIQHNYVKLTYIFADTLLLIFGFLAIIKTRRTKLGKFLIVGELLILAPILIDGSCYLLNMGSYNHYAMRFGFLNGFASMYTCCLYFENTDFSKSFDYIEPEAATQEGESVTPGDESDASDGETPKRQLTFKETLCSYKPVKILLANKKNKKFYVSLLAIALFAFVTCYFTYCLKTIFDNANNLYTTIDTDRSDHDFTAHYAHSEGGYNVIAWIFLLALILAILALLLVKRKIVFPKIIAVILCVFTIGQATFMYATLIDGNLASLSNYEKFDDMMDVLKDTDDYTCDGVTIKKGDYEYYRVSDYKGYVSSNVGYAKNVKTFATFSSNVDIANFNAAYNLNYISHAQGSIGVDSGQNKSFFGSCLLGSRYMLIHTSNNQKEKEVIKSDGTKVMEKQNNPVNMAYFRKLDEVPDTAFEIWENIYALPTCFTFKSDQDISVDKLNGDDWFECMQNHYTFLGGEGELFTEYPVTVVEKDGKIEIQSPINYEGEYFVKFDFPSDYEITVGSTVLESNKYTYGYSIENKGYHWPSTISCTNKKLTKDFVQEHVSCMIIEPLKMKTLYHNATVGMIRYDETRTGVKFTVEKAASNQYVFLSNVVLDASKVTINGKKAEFIENKAGLMIFKLREGYNAVETSYTSPYPFISIACALVSVLLAVGLTLLRRKTKFLQNGKTQTVLYYAAIALTTILVGFFIIFPLLLFIQKAFLNLNLGRFISYL